MAKYDGSGHEGTHWGTKEIEAFCKAVVARDKKAVWVDLVRDNKIISINASTMEVLDFSMEEQTQEVVAQAPILSKSED